MKRTNLHLAIARLTQILHDRSFLERPQTRPYDGAGANHDPQENQGLGGSTRPQTLHPLTRFLRRRFNTHRGHKSWSLISTPRLLSKVPRFHSRTEMRILDGDVLL